MYHHRHQPHHSTIRIVFQLLCGDAIQKKGRLEEAAPDDPDAAEVNTVNGDKALLQDKDDEAFNDEAVQEEEDDEEKHRCA